MDAWWRGGVIYEIYPRSFQDSDDDGIGDLAGIVARLDHVARLGADAVWLAPIFRSPMADMGYDVSDYRDIDPLFGKLADFDRLLERAHKLGLKVIVDLVLSHSSDRHPWFVESRANRDNPRADWYVWADPGPDGTPPNNWVSVFGGPAWEWDSGRRQYYLHNFLAAQPDFNLHNPEVQEALLDVMRYWLERGVDGFRLDTVNYYFHDRKLRPNPPARRDDTQPAVNPYEMQDHRFQKNRPDNIAFLRRMRTLMDQYDDRVLIGEVGEAPQRAIEIMADYTRGSERLHMAYCFDTLGPEFSARHFRSRIAKYFKAAPDGWPCWSFSNHDVTRHVTRWARHAADGDALARQAVAMLLSFPGSACLYQGEELGLTEAELEFDELTDPPGIRFWPEYKGRDGCRTPMPWTKARNAGFTRGTPWLPVKAPQAARNVAGQERDAGSVLAFYRSMLAWRHGQPALGMGSVRFFKTAEPVLAFRRTGPDGMIACVFNLSPADVRVKLRELELFGGAPVQAAQVEGGALRLGANGFAFLAPTGRGDAGRIVFKG